MRATILMMRSKPKRDFIKEVLISNDYKVIFETDNKFAGIQKCEELGPDIIIVDLDDFKPGQKYDPVTVKTIRRFNKKAIIIIAESMSSDGMWLRECIKAGANNVIIYPATPESVLRDLEKAQAPSII